MDTEQFKFEVAEREAFLAEKEGEFTEKEIQENALDFTAAAWELRDAN